MADGDGTNNTTPPQEIAVIPTQFCLTDEYAPIFSNGIFHNDKPFKHAMPLFMLQMSMIVFITHFIHLLLRRLKQPRIISSILAGIMIGPTMPYLIAIFIGKWNKNDMLRFRDEYIEFLFRVPNTSFLRTLAYYGVMLNLFLTGVKLDPSYAWRHGMKGVWIGISSFLLPFAVLFPASLVLKSHYAHFSQYPLVALTLSSTSFAVLGEVLRDIRLLNTELGRLAMAASYINDLFRWLFSAIVLIGLFESNNKTHPPGLIALCYIGHILIIFVVFWPWVLFVDKQATKSQNVSEFHVLSILLLVMAQSTIGDAVGATFLQGPVLMGLLVPDRSLLGTTLVQQVNLAASEVLMPLLFFTAGMVTDIRSLGMTPGWHWLQLHLLASAIVKFAGTALPAIYFKISLRSAALLGLIMNFKGYLEIVIFAMIKHGETISTPIYTHLLLFVVAVTSISTTLVVTYYDPLKFDGTVGCRSIQELKPQMELRLIIPVLNDEPVPAIVPFIEACCGSSVDSTSPVLAIVLHLVEIAGGVSSTVVAHKNSKGGLIDPETLDAAFVAFINYERMRQRSLMVQPFTATSPYKTMHQDICSLAMEKSTAFILLPFPRRDVMGVGVDACREALQNMMPLVSAQAPCSVGILIYHTNKTFKLPSTNYFNYQIELLFWGGPDDREALYIAMRLALHVRVQVRVTRFVSEAKAAQISEEIQQEEQNQDSTAIRDFKNRCNTNSHLSYDEITIDNAENMISVIHSINKGCDLVIVGRQPKSCSFLEEGLAEWTELRELGLVGDMLASSDFADGAFSVLVVQRHV